MGEPGAFPVVPHDLASVDEETVLLLVERLSDTTTKTPEGLLELPAGEGEAVVLGDIHADWPTLEQVAREHLEGATPVRRFILLGDYVDRAPEHLPFASLVNALLVLSLMAAYPDRVIALKGNHEAYRETPSLSCDLLRESDDAWGSPTVGERVLDLLEALPLAVTTESGAYLAHAGFPLKKDWKAALRNPTETTILQVCWNDVELSPTCGARGIDQTPINEQNLGEFLARSGTSVFLRGHDPAVVGKSLYHDRLLTLHTTRVYEERGLYLAYLPLSGRVRDLSGVRLRKIEPAPLPPARPSR